MTRKGAISQAIDLAKSTNIYSEEEKSDLVLVLENVKQALPLAHWTEASIFDAIDQYRLEHGKLPNLSDFIHKNSLPTKTVIRRVFGQRISDFLLKYYSSESPKKDREKNTWKMTENFLKTLNCNIRRYNVHPVRTMIGVERKIHRVAKMLHAQNAHYFLLYTTFYCRKIGAVRKNVIFTIGNMLCNNILNHDQRGTGCDSDPYKHRGTCRRIFPVG